MVEFKIKVGEISKTSNNKIYDHLQDEIDYLRDIVENIQHDISALEKGSGQNQLKGTLDSVGQGLGLATGLDFIKSIASEMKGLMTVVGSLVKVILAILSPIGNVIVGLLLPIILILKPIALAVNQIMMPFLQQGIKIMQADPKNAANLTAGFAVIMQGLQAVLLYSAGEIIKLVLTLGLNVLGLILGQVPGFGESIRSAIFDTLIPTISGFVDIGIASGISMLGINVVALSKSVGVETETFRNDFTGMIEKVFPNLSEDFVNGINESLKIADEKGIIQGFVSLADATETEMKAFANDSSSEIESAWNKIMNSFGVSLGITTDTTKDSKAWDFFKNLGGELVELGARAVGSSTRTY